MRNDDDWFAPVQGVWEFSAPSFRQAWWSKQTIADGIPIKCQPLADILATVEPINYFDFLSLDVEGAEYEVLIHQFVRD